MARSIGYWAAPSTAGASAGEQLAMQRAIVFYGRGYPVLNDYRDVLGGLSRSIWTVFAGQLELLFLAHTPLDLKLI